MKIILLSDANSIHTIRWVKALSKRGYEIILVSFSISLENKKDFLNLGIKTYDLEISKKIIRSGESSWRKIRYIFAVRKIISIIGKEKPDILHAHFLSSYGLLGRLTGYKPFFCSVWGSDIMSFPNKNIIAKRITKFILTGADIICATSNVMKNELTKYINRDVHVIPFGVDTDFFKPLSEGNKKRPSELVIGSVKGLHPRYGIDILIRVFNKLKSEYKDPLKLVIAGDGPQKRDLLNLIKELRLEKDISILGSIPHENVPEILYSFDIFVALSREESFGVAVLEASSCGLPVVVSNAGGLPEVVIKNKTGFIVSKDEIETALDVIKKLLSNKDLRKEMGINGRNFVLKNYCWESSVSNMCKIYNEFNTAISK